MRLLLDFIKDERGAETVEVGVTLSVMAITSIASYSMVSSKVTEGLAGIADGIQGATDTPGG